MTGRITVLVVLIAAAGGSSAVAARDQQLVRAGNEALAAGRFDEAAALYAKAAENPDQRGLALFNTGVLRARQGNSEGAAEMFGDAVRAGLPPQTRAWALYNRGVVLAAADRNSESANEFKQALLLAPGNDAMRTNLEIVLARIRLRPRRPTSEAQNEVQQMLDQLPDQSFAFVHGRAVTAPAARTDW